MGLSEIKSPIDGYGDRATKKSDHRSPFLCCLKSKPRGHLLIDGQHFPIPEVAGSFWCRRFRKRAFEWQHADPDKRDAAVILVEVDPDGVSANL